MGRTTRPEPSTCQSYHRCHVDRVPEGDVVDALERQVDDTLALFARFSPDAAVEERYLAGVGPGAEA